MKFNKNFYFLLKYNKEWMEASLMRIWKKAKINNNNKKKKTSLLQLMRANMKLNRQKSKKKAKTVKRSRKRKS